MNNVSGNDYSVACYVSQIWIRNIWNSFIVIKLLLYIQYNIIIAIKLFKDKLKYKEKY